MVYQGDRKGRPYHTRMRVDPPSSRSVRNLVLGRLQPPWHSMELLPHAGKAEISWRVHFESPVECAAQCLVRREGVEHGVLLVISIHGFTPGVPGKRLMVLRLASQGCED